MLLLELETFELILFELSLMVSILIGLLVLFNSLITFLVSIISSILFVSINSINFFSSPVVNLNFLIFFLSLMSKKKYLRLSMII